MVDAPDSLGMASVTRALPEQLTAARARVRELDGLAAGGGVRSVVLAGMGGSGIAADVAATAAQATSAVPIVVVKDYRCPAFVGPDTLVVAVSFSGRTEETLEFATDAVAAGARLVVVAAGGPLERLAERVGAAVVPVDPTIPMPRAAIGALSVAVLTVLAHAGLVHGLDDQLDAATAQLTWRRDRLVADDAPVRSLVRRIGRTLPILYGGDAVGEVAARRWKAQVNENPKVAAFANQVPELTHNEICGWGQHGDVTRQVFTLVLLRHDHEHPQAARRLDLVAEICDEIVADVLVVRAAGDGPLAQLFDLVLVGDLVSLQMAADAGVDPGPVPILDDIKTRLASP